MGSSGAQEASSAGGEASVPATPQQNGRAPGGGQPPDPGTQAPPAILATPTTMVVAVAVLVVYVAALWLLFANRGDKSWDRMVYLLSGFEAIVFVAVGAIFGTTVQRASVTTAQTQAQQARAEATAANNRANVAAAQGTSGAALAAGIRSVARTSQSQPADTGPADTRAGDRERRGPRDAALASSGLSPDLTFLVNLADELFPPGR